MHVCNFFCVVVICYLDPLTFVKPLGSGCQRNQNVVAKIIKLEKKRTKSQVWWNRHITARRTTKTQYLSHFNCRVIRSGLSLGNNYTFRFQHVGNLQKYKHHAGCYKIICAHNLNHSYSQSAILSQADPPVIKLVNKVNNIVASY